MIVLAILGDIHESTTPHENDLQIWMVVLCLANTNAYFLLLGCLGGIHPRSNTIGSNRWFLYILAWKGGSAPLKRVTYGFSYAISTRYRQRFSFNLTRQNRFSSFQIWSEPAPKPTRELILVQNGSVWLEPSQTQLKPVKRKLKLESNRQTTKFSGRCFLSFFFFV